MIENAEQMLRRRQEAAQKHPLAPDFISSVLNDGFRTVESQQLAIVTERSRMVLEKIGGIRNELIAAGVENPSDLRLRAEFVRIIGSGWVNYAQDAFDKEDFPTYMFFMDMGMGTLAVATAIIEGDNLNRTKDNILDSTVGAEVTQAIAGFAQSPNIISDTNFFMGASNYLRECARLLVEDPTGEETIKLALDTLSAPIDEDPYPLPRIPEFAMAGANIATKLLEEVKKIQEQQTK